MICIHKKTKNTLYNTVGILKSYFISIIVFDIMYSISE